MKTDTLVILLAVGAVAFFAFSGRAGAQDITVNVPEPREEGLLEQGGRLLDNVIDQYYPSS
tara:strand:+ start:112 stop:294 length:183 start_codon:yes stop_codon:yes gene_type:complete